MSTPLPNFFDLQLWKFIRKYIWCTCPYIVYWIWGYNFERSTELAIATIIAIVVWLCIVVNDMLTIPINYK